MARRRPHSVRDIRSAIKQQNPENPEKGDSMSQKNRTQSQAQEPVAERNSDVEFNKEVEELNKRLDSIDRDVGISTKTMDRLSQEAERLEKLLPSSDETVIPKQLFQLLLRISPADSRKEIEELSAKAREDVRNILAEELGIRQSDGAAAESRGRRGKQRSCQREATQQINK